VSVRPCKAKWMTLGMGSGAHDVFAGDRSGSQRIQDGISLRIVGAVHWQSNLHSRPSSGFGRNQYFPMMILDDSIAQGEAKACAFAGRFG